jgi:hypothetical protein
MVAWVVVIGRQNALSYAGNNARRELHSHSQ